jgi:hypothetical protein
VGFYHFRFLQPQANPKLRAAILGDGLDGLKPTIKSLSITNTTSGSMKLVAVADIENPTVYSATIPFADVKILANNTLLGHVTARKLELHKGVNQNLSISATWEPGDAGRRVGAELLSQWISGMFFD